MKKLYLAAVLDLTARKIVGWSMRDYLQVKLATSAFMMTIQRQRLMPGLIQHLYHGIPRC